MIHCMVLDDQPQAVNILTDHIRHIPELNVKLASTNPNEALRFAQTEKIDLVFLDIEMPEISGLEFMEAVKVKLGKDSPTFILTTAYDDYAIKGYEYGVFLYLKKPIKLGVLHIAVQKYLTHTNGVVPLTQQSFFFIDMDGKKLKIEYDEVVYFQASRNYVDIFTLSSKFVVYNSLSYFDDSLPKSRFIKTHRAYLVNINHIKGVKGSSLFVELKAKQIEISIGRTFRDDVYKRLGLSS